MKILPIYTYGFEILRKKTTPLTKVDDNIIKLIPEMYATMNRASGIGLAAPQIGKDIALTVIDISKIEGEEKQKPLTLINPKIIDFHGECIMEEGCLSIPGVRADVERPKTIYLEYRDLDMNKKSVELKGIISRVAQHEIDHLNGILFLDHLKKDQKKIFKDRLTDIRKGDIEVSYLLAEIKKPSRQKKKSA